MRTLQYQTSDGEWRTVSEDGVISRLGVEPSGQWLFLGLRRMGTDRLIGRDEIFANPDCVPRSKSGRVSGHYRVLDNDHGHIRLQVSPKIVNLVVELRTS